MGQKKEKHEKNVKKYIVNSQGGAKHLSPTQNIQNWVLCIDSDLACFKEKNKDWLGFISNLVQQGILKKLNIFMGKIC